MWAHLAAFKRRHHADLADGEHYANKVTYPHIFPEDSRRLNILPSVRESF